MLSCDHYLRPLSLAEAFDQLDRFGDAGRIVAGATDVLPWARQGRAGDVHYSALIDVSGVAELRGVELRGERIRMGANTTIAEFLANPVLVQQAPVLKHCAVWFADDQIREQATVGGNLINASPAADATPALLALNARLTLHRRGNGVCVSRTLPLAEFITGPGMTRMHKGEILGEIDCDALPRHGGAFEKVGHRRSLVISTVCAAALVRLDGAGCFEDVRLALGAVGPIPERLPDCESFLLGKHAEIEVLREGAALAAQRVRSRSRQRYRREVVVRFVERALVNALAELGVDVPRHEETLHA
mgnify:CR=1 FL=1